MDKRVADVPEDHETPEENDAPWNNDTSAGILSSLFRACRLAMHLFCGTLLAAVYPHLHPGRQRRIMRSWSRQLLDILNIGIHIEGPAHTRCENGCLTVANHVSWLDIFVLNAVHPSRFVAKSEVRGWPLIGWLCRRSGTIFIERGARQDASQINRRIGLLLKKGGSISLFPEGTTTDGAQVGHFHSALLQSAIDTGTRLRPVALRYLDEKGRPSRTAPFTGDTSLVQSIWRILRCTRHNVLVIFTPALLAGSANRRILARTAQEAIAHALHAAGAIPHIAEQPSAPSFPQPLLSSRSAYALLVDPLLQQGQK